MIKCLSLWILFILTTLVSTQSPNVDLFVSGLSASLSNVFSNLQVFLNANDLATNIKTTPNSVTNAVSLVILNQSKRSTESLVSQTSAVVDIIQSNITSQFATLAPYPPNVFSIDCALTNYSFYFRAKAILNGTYQLMNCTTQNMNFTNDSFLNNLPTNRQNSTVHIPTNVFETSDDIQQVSNYTINMDQTFALSGSNSQIKWQFFCSTTGFFKIFPGIRWFIQNIDMDNDSTYVDFFDCRSQQWFLESASHPKKMVIMVDRSGSMKGRRRMIANQTIYEILNTITENDFFNVILFSKDVVYADNMTSILMQATDKNKMFIMSQLNATFIPDGIAEYDVGLNASFTILENEKNQDVNNSIIYDYLLMIISDGSPMNYQDAINAGNKNIQARIFTYVTGQGCTERDLVRQMACNNRGFYVEIATLSDVKENVQKYLNVVSRHNAIMQNAFLTWTGVNEQQIKPSQIPAASSATMVSSIQLGLPLITYSTNATTVSPIMATTPQSNSSTPVTIEILKYTPIQMFVTVSKAAYDIRPTIVNMQIGNLLGVAGVDVPISDFIKTAPFWMIGVNAYLFGVTQNGYVIFHPRFRPQYKDYLKYFYRNVDIGEVEISVNQVITFIYQNQTILSTLRNQIIKVLPGDMPKFVESRTTYDVIDDFKTAIACTRNYFITGIMGTSYKFGLAVPSNQVVSQYSTLPDYRSMDLSVFSTDLKNNASFCNVSAVYNNQNGVALKLHEFCHINPELAALLLQGPLCLLRAVLINPMLRNICITLPDGTNTTDTTLDQYIKSVYNEANNTQYLPQQWSSKSSIAQSVGAIQIFSMHHFGLIRYYNYANLSYPNFIKDHNAGLEDPLYQETVLTSNVLKNNGILVVRTLPKYAVDTYYNTSTLVFTVTTPIVSGSEYKGIVGAQVNNQFYLKILMTPQCISEQCLSCSNTSLLDCYVVTSAGIVVLNNLYLNNTGKSLKDIDHTLMLNLINNGIFQTQTLYDFQAVCTNMPGTNSFSNILIDPFTKFFRLSVWLIYEIIIIIQNISLTSLFWSSTNQEINPQYPVPTVYDGRPCYNQLSSYFITSPSNSTNNTTSMNNITRKGNIVCPPCTKTWYSTKISNTNLILIVVYKPGPNCTSECQSNFGDTTEITRILSMPINNALVQPANYFSKFVPFTKKENSSECTDDATHSAMPLKWIILLHLLFLLCFKIL